MESTSPLPPLAQPLALFDHMIAREATALVLREGDLDEFDIKTVGGKSVIYFEDADMLGPEWRKRAFDPVPRCLFDIDRFQDDTITTYSIEDEDMTTRFMMITLKALDFGVDAKALFTPAGRTTPVTLTLRGDWLGPSAEIVDVATGSVVARTHRGSPSTWPRCWWQWRKYHLEVAAGADMALLAALCFCLEEKHTEIRLGWCATM